MSADKLLAQFSNRFTRAFALMEVAEEEITKAVKSYPEQKEALNKAFSILTPSSEMSTMHRNVYRHHAAELLGRVAKGELQDADVGTAAEVLISLHVASLKAPFKREPQVLYEQLFALILPEHADVASSQLRESHPGAAQQLESELRRKLSNPERKAFIKTTLKTKLTLTVKAKAQMTPLFEEVA